jgi:predicted aspartyl protease
MGLTNLKLIVKNPLVKSKKQEVEFLVDSGAVYSVIDKKILSRLGITPTGKRTFFLANNTSVDRKIGDALFEYGGESGYSKVVFGEPGDSNLLGIITLESLGYVLDPIQRKLLHLPMLLASLK